MLQTTMKTTQFLKHLITNTFRQNEYSMGEGGRGASTILIAPVLFCPIRIKYYRGVKMNGICQS